MELSTFTSSPFTFSPASSCLFNPLSFCLPFVDILWTTGPKSTAFFTGAKDQFQAPGYSMIQWFSSFTQEDSFTLWEVYASSIWYLKMFSKIKSTQPWLPIWLLLGSQFSPFSFLFRSFTKFSLEIQTVKIKKINSFQKTECFCYLNTTGQIQQQGILQLQSTYILWMKRKRRLRTGVKRRKDSFWRSFKGKPETIATIVLTILILWDWPILQNKFLLKWSDFLQTWFRTIFSQTSATQ